MGKIVRKKQIVLMLLAAVLVSMCAGVVMAKRLPAQGGVYEQLKVFTEALSYVESNYVDEVESEKVIQGAKTESVPLGELKKLSEDRYLIFDELLMQFAMSNCITVEDTNGNRKLLKKRMEEKIDNVAALMDAYVAYKANKEAFE